MTARPFVLARHEDLSGISGVGIVAEGVVWTGGSASLHWMTEWETFVYWPGGVEEILAVHGHDGATVVRYLDENEPIHEQYPPDPPDHDNSPGISWESHDDPEVNR
jgi:hypothetical protein